LIGTSQALTDLKAEVERIARSDAKVLITGESGAGKEVVARAINSASPRSQQAFVAVNCAGIPETLLESELFGHVKGSFTGAYRDKQGKLEMADGGTIFLDEIGDLHEASQAKLLRVLQDGEVQRLGGEQPIRVATRVISATNRNLEDLVSAGTFRQDLYYRLGGFPIRVPALRERLQDVGDLVPYFLAEFCTRNNFRPKTIEAGALALLERYGWPGNVRELRNVVERMAIMAGGDRVTEDAVPMEVRLPSSARPAAGLQEVRQAAERDRIRRALEETDWNVAGAARLLGTERTALHKRIRTLGLRRH
jgi:two-component system nitrogen regulation response regulator NtrX